MINLVSVSAQTEVYGQDVAVFADADFHLPPGRYALLSANPEYHRAVIDVLAGLRMPRRGQVTISGSISWPIGRNALARGKANGIDLINLVADLYDLDRAYAGDLVTMLVSRPDYVAEPLETWPPHVQREFMFALALVPEFDIYVIDAPIPYEESRFTRLWQALFEERLVGKTLILSSPRQKQLLDYCAKGLIHERAGLKIEHDLEQCIERFPAQPTREELGVTSNAGGYDDAEVLF
jgi:capsular polysaccharide transport system ATP-binding protein